MSTVSIGSNLVDLFAMYIIVQERIRNHCQGIPKTGKDRQIYISLLAFKIVLACSMNGSPLLESSLRGSVKDRHGIIGRPKELGEEYPQHLQLCY